MSLPWQTLALSAVGKADIFPFARVCILRNIYYVIGRNFLSHNNASKGIVITALEANGYGNKYLFTKIRWICKIKCIEVS